MFNLVGAILTGIFVPLIVISLLFGGFLYYRKYEFVHINHITNIFVRRHDDTTALVVQNPAYDSTSDTANIDGHNKQK